MTKSSKENGLTIRKQQPLARETLFESANVP